MKIKDILKENRKKFSFEFFPPKSLKAEENLFNAIGDLKKLSPDYVSVTYGALGSSQGKSLELIKKIKEQIGFEVMAHYTCIGATEQRVDLFLEELAKMGVENILALRGDAPDGTIIDDTLSNSPFKFARDLVEYIKTKANNFTIGVAGYPEVHPECDSIQKDIKYLKEKVDAGADFIVTQLFFNNDDFFKFRDNARKIGITVPIFPGIMPVENYNQIKKITSLCGAKIPEKITDYFSKDDVSDEDKLKFGVEYTIKQCQQLLKEKIDGIHFYTLNKSSATREVFQNLI